MNTQKLDQKRKFDLLLQVFSFLNFIHLARTNLPSNLLIIILFLAGIYLLYENFLNNNLLMLSLEPNHSKMNFNELACINKPRITSGLNLPSLSQILKYPSKITQITYMQHNINEY
ncbi:hypothetical protein U5B43_08535 [Campylobacter sp. 9BO]|uniref:hypothetical protein n=1 Tax=Campylobacter sp. 9BO TaxID=3424759 RepID=UPI003D34C272